MLRLLVAADVMSQRMASIVNEKLNPDWDQAVPEGTISAPRI